MRKRRASSPGARGALKAWMMRRQRGDRGATLVEAAIVMPVFILIIFGIFEFSGNIMTRTGASSAVKGGMRLAVVQGNFAMADQAILKDIERDGAGIDQDHIEQVIIWRVNDNTTTTPNQPGNDANEPPGACIMDPAPDDVSRVVVSSSKHPCNVYNNPQAPGGAFELANKPLAAAQTPPATVNGNYAEYYFGCDTTSDPGTVVNKMDCGWQPHTRRQLTKFPGRTDCTIPHCESTDVIGIYIRAHHQSYTGFFGSGITVTAESVGAIEPQDYDRS